MKVAIVGGGGRVGSNAALCLQFGAVAREIALIDVNEEMAAGEALDLRHGASLAGSQVFTSGGYSAAEGADILVVTAGLRRKPDESRLDLINRNVGLFRSILDECKKVKLADNAVLVVVSNPVDILTYLAVKDFGIPAQRVIGLGTLLDTTRFRSLVAEHLGADPLSVNVWMLGEHGDSMVPIWSSATVGGVPISSHPRGSEQELQEVTEFTRKSGAEVIRLKGGAGYAVGWAIRELVKAIAEDSHSVLPVSTLMQGQLGISDVCFSLPTVVGRNGALEVIVPKLAAEEQTKLQEGAKVLRQTIDQVLAAG
ncbi:MAG: malate dehydrogenase [Armatimonadetes bacterium]|nr:malate dehydrogenase [Armatimonadota bacterium]